MQARIMVDLMGVYIRQTNACSWSRVGSVRLINPLIKFWIVGMGNRKLRFCEMDTIFL